MSSPLPSNKALATPNASKTFASAQTLTTLSQALRWGALVFGIFYGFSHQQTITSRDKSAAVKHEYDRKQKLIDQAKAEFAKKNAPPGSVTAGGGGRSR